MAITTSTTFTGTPNEPDRRAIKYAVAIYDASCTAYRVLCLV